MGALPCHGASCRERVFKCRALADEAEQTAQGGESALVAAQCRAERLELEVEGLRSKLVDAVSGVAALCWRGFVLCS